MPRSHARSLWAAKLAGRLAPTNEAEIPVAPGLRPAFRGVILGIDPSLRGSGLAILDVRSRDEAVLLESRTLKISQRYTFIQCLGEIARTVAEVCAAHPITDVAVEETIYVQNFRTAQILGAARGAAIGVVAARGLPVSEYAPRRVKQAVAGYGAASMEQVAAQMRHLLKLPSDLPFDESDAAAVALCHAYTHRG